jgi:hypothetical protein
MKTGRVSWIARIALLGALATGCIDATTVYVVPDPGATGDDGGATGDDGPSGDAPTEGGAVVDDGSTADSLSEGAALDGAPSNTAD